MFRLQGYTGIPMYSTNQGPAKTGICLGVHWRARMRQWRAEIVARLDRLEAQSVNPPERLYFDALTHTVSLDGTHYTITDPKAFAVYKVIADACPQPLTKVRIQKIVPGCKGKKRIPQLICMLPEPLRASVRSGPYGYWLDLSQPFSRSKTSRSNKSST